MEKMISFDDYQTLRSHDNFYELCLGKKLPYMDIKQANKELNIIFFDITDQKVDLQSVIDELKSIYKSYLDFFMLDDPLCHECLLNDSMFELVVSKEHSQCFYKQLYYFLVDKLA